MTPRYDHDVRRLLQMPESFKPGGAVHLKKYFSLTMLSGLLWSCVIAKLAEIDLLSYEQRSFLEEYWPACAEFLRSLPGVGLVRQSFRLLDRHQQHGPTRLLELPDELLLDVVSFVATPANASCGHRRCRDASVSRRDLDSLAVTCRRLRLLIGPRLYDTVSILHGWSRTSRALTTLSKSPHIVAHTQTLIVTPRIRLGTLWIPASNLGPPLALSLSRFDKLSNLCLDIPDTQVQSLKQNLAEASLCLSTIKALVLGPMLEFVIAYCPRVVSISSFDAAKYNYHPYRTYSSILDDPHSVALVNASGSADHLQRFEICSRWTSADLRYLYEHVPQVQDLALISHFGEDAHKVIPALKRFEHLKSLALPDARQLDPEFRIVGRCGTPYARPGGRERLERDQRQWEKSARKRNYAAAKMVFQHLSCLEQLWLDDRMLYTPVKSPEGTRSRELTFRYETRQTLIDL